MKQKQLRQLQERRGGSSLLLKMFALVALMLCSVGSVWGIGLSKEVTLPNSKDNGQGHWVAETKTLSWTEGYSNVIDVAEAAQDLSSYMGITVDSQDLTAGATFRIILESGGKSYQYVMNTAGVHQILFSEFKIDNTNTAISSDELKNAKIQMAGRYGGEGTRSVKINRLGLIQVKWWNVDRQATITPDELTTFGTSKSGNDFAYSSGWHEVRIFLDGSDANEIGSVIVNTNSGDWYTLGYMSDKGWCASLDEAKAKNAKLTEVRIFAKQLGTYNISSVVFTQPYEVRYWASDAVVPDNCDWWYTVGDDETKIKETRKFAPGTKVTFHASDANTSTYVFNGWYKKDVSKDNNNGGFFIFGDKNWVATTNLNEDLNYLPEFQPSHAYKAEVSGEGGTAIVYAKGDEGKTNIHAQKYQSWLMNSGVVFEAKPADGYTFYKWVEGGTANPLEFNDHADATVYTRTAIFAKAIGKPECNHYGSRTHGDNYLDITQLNPGDGVTITENNGRDIKVPSTGGYMSFVFNNKYNLKNLVAWTISNNADLRARVDYVEFFGGDDGMTSLVKCYTDAGERGTKHNKTAIGTDVTSKLEKVREIRINFKSGEERTYNIQWICFSFEHRGPTLPTLNNGTEPNMVIRQNGTLELSNTPGYWRQFANSESTEPTYEEINGVKIPSNQWSSAYKFDNMQKGDYYFGARDSGDPCALGYSHPETDWVKVHVEVTDMPIVAAKTDPEGLDATFDIYMGPDHKDWKVTNNSFVNFGTGVSFAVSDVPGYEFVGWYLNGAIVSNEQNGYNYTQDSEGRNGVWSDVTAVAKFKREYNNNNFTGYFPFINRLRAQWNFDLCDNIRFNVSALGTNWTEDATTNYLSSTGNGYKEYFYNQPLDYEVLKYGNGHEIPISAGLQFKADANQVSIRVNYKDGKMTGTQLVCKVGVRMTVPYVENSCRNDRDENYPSVVNHSAEQIAEARAVVFASDYVEGTDTDKEGIAKGNFTKEEIEEAKAIVSAADYVQGSNKMAEVAATKNEACNTAYVSNPEGFKNCYHHMKRDILYVALEGGKDFVDAYNQTGGGYFVDDAIVDNEFTGKTMFYPAGSEQINGVNFTKADYLGVPGTPCTFELKREAVFDRIAVNRNLTASYYTEYIDKMGYETPQPGMRIRVDTKGLRVASDGSTSGYWDGAISMTYGGWSLNGTKYSNYDGEEIQDSWGENTVFNGNDPTLADVKKIPTPSDGFPIISNAAKEARSESLMPSTSTDKYHLGNEGKFSLTSYKENLSPWTLPCRGSYVKFEPTHPGVLNIHVVQEAGKEYYIADEFGKLDREIPNTMTWAKGATEENHTINYNSTTGGYTSTVKDYVKYSFNVYPGKSYYFFSNDASFGFAGFFFEPYVTRINNTKELDREDILMDEFSFDDNSDYSAPATWYPDGSQPVAGVPGVYAKTVYSPKKAGLDPDASGNDFSKTEDWQPYTINYSRNAIKATYRRDGAGFQANKWTSICLPFSMNQQQMEDQFGVGTKVVMLRDIQDNKSGIPTTLTTANFIMHENQDIIACYPYFIKPTKSTHSITANVSLFETTPSIVSVESNGNIAGGSQYGGIDCFQFTGNFESTEIPAGSYVMTNDGKLTRTTNKVTAKPYRAFLKFTGTDYTQATSKVIKAANYDFLADEEGMEETSVEELLFQSGIFADKANVYNVSGQLVRANADNLQGLPKGIYIVNGKKFIVK